MIESPGKIRKMGPFEKLYFGSDTASFWQSITDYFKNASLESYLVDTIEETMGEIYFHFCFGFSHILFKSI
jgi:2-dehydropantoate 2-reductase